MIPARVAGRRYTAKGRLVSAAAAGPIVTFVSFDGGVLRGTFHGTFETPGKDNPGDGPVSAAGGRFVAMPVP